MKTFILASLITSAALAHAVEPSKPATDSPPAQEKVQIALLLDTSNSMDGLIDQAKTQLWKMVNTFTDAKRDGKTPYVEVALYEYGNNGLDIANNWIRQVEPFTRDLDEISRELFALKTNGGDEYCGAVIRRALGDLAWDSSPKTYKAIFVAGNEPFTQGPVDARQACRDSISKGIVVNTIHCGSRDEGISGAWHDGAALGEGKFLIINQDKAVAHITAPQDKEIAELGAKLNTTYLAYGTKAREGRAKQLEADAAAESNAASGAANQRAISKASASYSNDAWDLVDAVKDGKKKLVEIPAAQLPDAMQKMSPAEREAHLAKITAERTALQSKILELNKAREAHVAAEVKKMSAANGGKTLDQALVETARAQAAAKGYKFE
ncbi:MAG: vWA domain-containing protein [Verrucomicrobiota bacterium]